MADVTSLRELSGPGSAGEVVPASAVQAASLAALRDLFAVITDKADPIRL